VTPAGDARAAGGPQVKVTQMDSSQRKAPTWRRRWTRAPSQKRAVAATALGDLFERRRVRTALAKTFAVSLVVHLIAGRFLLTLTVRAPSQTAAREDSYLRRVIQKDRARHVAADASRRTTLPPPPPDPEQFVSDTLTQELTQDLTQVTSGLLDVQLEQSLTQHVHASLEAELQEASKRIATGTLSKDEIKKLHRQFREKAMDAARDWREVHREEYQVKIAAKTVTQWYEQRVASQIRRAVQDALFTGRSRIWDRRLGNAYDAPGFIEADNHQTFAKAYHPLTVLLTGRFRHGHFGGNDRPPGLSQCKDLEHGWRQLPGWPDKPSATQAGILERLLADYGKGWERAFDGYTLDYYPHKSKEMAKKKAAMAATWGRLMALAKRFRERAEQGTPARELKPDLAACINTLKQFTAAWTGTLVGRGRQAACATINQALRSRLLRGPFRDVAYRRLIDMLVEKLRPPVEQLAEGQFREGMVLSEAGVHQAMKEFRVKAVALLRRDMEQTISRPFFYRKLFDSAINPYRNKITGASSPPTQQQIDADEQALKTVLAKLPAADRGFVEARAGRIKAEINAAITASIDEMLRSILTREGRLERRYYQRAETVDYSDPFKQKLEARDMAWKGRKQDLADLTEEGVPDTSTPLVALASGVGTGQVALKPVVATMHPGHFGGGPMAAGALRGSRSTAPPAPSPWGFVTQPTVKPPFRARNFEGIPFLINFPNLDGDLSDWGRIRPLVLRNEHVGDPAFKRGPILVYAAWNYQGFFFGYKVEQKRTQFSLPAQYYIGQDGITLIKDPRLSQHNKFVSSGDSFIVMIDTLDARLPFRGDPHAQEFYILPRGTATDPDLPGAERVFASRRYGQTDGNFGWGRRISNGVLFPPQPRSGPDGSGPYRVTQVEDHAYTVELFLPRRVFKVPVFAPGWYIGFDCYVGTGKQPTGSGARFQGKGWCTDGGQSPCFIGNSPSRWGDLLLLGTDARVSVQDAAPESPGSTVVVPGHSYLVTVKDPDRNVHLTAVDTVLISAEVIPSGDGKARLPASDVELYVLKETGKNSSIFRGYINTQPGAGSDVRGVLEVFPGNEVRFGYVDFADSKGRRNVIYEQRLPVIAPMLNISQAAP